MSFHALANRLLSASQAAFGLTSSGVALGVWWKLTPSATTFPTAISGAVATPPAADADSQHAAFEREREMLFFNVPVSSFSRPPFRDEIFLAGYSATSTGSDVKKYSVSKVTRHPVMAHYHIEAFLTS